MRECDELGEAGELFEGSASNHDLAIGRSVSTVVSTSRSDSTSEQHGAACISSQHLAEA